MVYASRHAPSGPPMIGCCQRWSPTAMPSKPPPSVSSATSPRRPASSSASTGQPKSARCTTSFMRRGALGSGDVGPEPVEEPAERGELPVGEPGAQSGVERGNGLHEPAERGLAVPGQLDAMCPPVLRVTAPGDEAGRLHAVEVMRQGRALDAHRVGELSLRAVRPSLERDQHEPRGERAARLRQRLVEGPADRLGGAGQQEADRLCHRVFPWPETIDIERFDVELTTPTCASVVAVRPRCTFGLRVTERGVAHGRGC